MAELNAPRRLPGESGQLALHLALREEATLANFCPREPLRELLAALETPASEALNFVHGASGVGKSHLLQGLCHALDGAVYLPLGELLNLPPADLLRDLEGAALVAIDDLQCIAGRDTWEEALFHLINRARQQACSLWFAARQPPATLNVRLADLRSRLGGGVTWAMPESSDDENAEILQFRAARRGLELPPAVARYLCLRDRRSLADLMATLERLDRASLQLQRPLTVPLVKAVMDW